jgi:photosystem II stability/assembly factor-like uncharacterized protein
VPVKSKLLTIVLDGIFILLILGLIIYAMSVMRALPVAPAMLGTEEIQQPTLEPVSPSPSEASPYPGLLEPYPYPGITQPSGTPIGYLENVPYPTPNESAVPPTQTNPPTPTNFESPTPVNTPDAPQVPVHYLRTEFTDNLHGWLSGMVEWGNGMAPAIAATTDGGETWRALPIPLNGPNDATQVFWYFNNGNLSNLLFRDANDGWYYKGRLFQTHDGGHSWQEEHTRGAIIQMGKAIDGSLWALEQTRNSWTLWQVSGKSYNQWNKLSSQFPVDMNNVSLAVIDSQHIWISYWVTFLGDSPNPGTQLFVTSDGGDNWEKVTPPQPCDRDPTILSPVDTQEIWMGCGFPAGAGAGISAVFESPDGGESWIEKRYDTHGYFKSIEALSKSFVYMTYVYGLNVTFTYDGGKTWSFSGIYCPLGSPNADFIDPLHGWAVCDSVVNRTVDGGRTWECIDLPGENTCGLWVPANPDAVQPTGSNP